MQWLLRGTGGDECRRGKLQSLPCFSAGQNVEEFGGVDS